MSSCPDPAGAQSDRSGPASVPISTSLSESDKENSGVASGNRRRESLPPTPKSIAFGKFVELFSPIKSSEATRFALLQNRYQECDEERQRLRVEVRRLQDENAAESQALVDSHRNAALLMERTMQEQSAAYQLRISNLKGQLESERLKVKKFVTYFNQTESWIESYRTQIDMNRSLQQALRSASSLVDAMSSECIHRIQSKHVDGEIAAMWHDFEHQMASMLAGNDAELGDLKHGVFELEACLEQEQSQAASFQKCIQTMEDEILELQVQRDQVLEELKRCASIPDLELARAEAELIATECMVELAGAGDSLDQATHMIMDLNRQLSDLHSDVGVITGYAADLDCRLADSVAESELFRTRYYELANDGGDLEALEARPGRFEPIIDDASKIVATLKANLHDAICQNLQLKSLLSSSEVSFDASKRTQQRLRRELADARDIISAMRNYESVLQLVLGNALENVQDLVDSRLSDVQGPVLSDRNKGSSGIADS